MGLEPMSSGTSSNSNSSAYKTASSGMAAPTSASELTQGSKTKLTFLDLPLEAQKDIIKHVSTVYTL
jgi:hypothetical protein